jgi:hypothetical protein
MAGYTGPNNRRYQRPRWWWLSLSAIPIALGAVWGLVRSRKRTRS